MTPVLQCVFVILDFLLYSATIRLGLHDVKDEPTVAQNGEAKSGQLLAGFDTFTAVTTQNANILCPNLSDS